MKNALYGESDRVLEKTPSLLLMSYMSGTIKSRVIAYQSDGHELPPRAYTIEKEDIKHCLEILYGILWYVRDASDASYSWV